MATAIWVVRQARPVIDVFTFQQSGSRALLGGHTVQDPELKFGYSVTGSVDPKRIWRNAGAKPGDRLILTKPIGTGVIGTAIKNRRAPEALAAQAVEAMRT